MRYGLVREGPDLPPAGAQRRLIDDVACEIVHESRTIRPSQDDLKSLLVGLRAGDELVVHSLCAFQLSTGELAVLLRRLSDKGVTVKLLDTPGGPYSLVPDGDAQKLLNLLADHEAQRPRSRIRKRSRENLKPLTVHQIAYARALLKKGESLRSVGLLFQLTPSELMKLLDPGR
jgi:hypothetical protein